MNKSFLAVLLILLAVFIVLQSVIISKTPLVSWDESVYIGMGKFIYSNGHSGLFESFRPVLLPLILGAGWKIGINAVLFGRIVSLLFSSAVLVIFYLICRKYFGKISSLFTSLVLASIPVYFIFTTMIFTDIASSFFILLAFYFFLKKRPYMTSLFAGIAALTRFPAGMFFAFFVILFAFRKEKVYFINMCLIFILCLAPFFAVNFYFGSNPFLSLIDASTHQNNYTFSEDSLFYLKQIFLQSFFLIFLVPGIFYAFKNKKYELLLFAIIPLIYFTSIINKQIRFSLMFLPFLVLLAAYGFYMMIKSFKENRFSVFCLILFLIFSVGLSVNTLARTQFNNNASEFSVFSTTNNLTIITSEPTFAVYSDNKFIPVYFDVYKGYNTFLFYENRSDYFIYASYAYPCDKYQNVSACDITKTKLIDQFFNKKLVKNSTSYVIFK